MELCPFVEQYDGGLAFYLNGDLQFDTADEAVYHEFLAVPAIALAAARFPDRPLRVLICGGGDGLALRDVLRFGAVAEVDLVDYSPEVLDLGRSLFAPFNHQSLASDRVRVTVADAWDWTSDRPYHAILCDFTYPSHADETRVYSREWFSKLLGLLEPGGLLATNGVSVDRRTTGFWCLYQTLLAAGWAAKPLAIPIESFRRHGYGTWGFFLASDRPIGRPELTELALPPGLGSLTVARFLAALRFPVAEAADRDRVHYHSIAAPILFHYLLNPEGDRAALGHPIADQWSESEPIDWIDFADLHEPAQATAAANDPSSLTAIAQHWLQALAAIDPQQLPPKLPGPPLPVLHPDHDARMVAERAEDWRSLLDRLDWRQLLTELQRQSRDLPPKLAAEIQGAIAQIERGATGAIERLPPAWAETITLLSVVLMTASLVGPDAAFAKGFSGFSRGSSRRYSSGGSSGNGSGSCVQYNDAGEQQWVDCATGQPLDGSPADSGDLSGVQWLTGLALSSLGGYIVYDGWQDLWRRR
jgi:spermidine synthase